MNRQQKAHKAMKKYFEEGSPIFKKMIEDQKVKEVTDKLLNEDGIFRGTFVTGGPINSQFTIHKI